jgi:hypothetical protein
LANAASNARRRSAGSDAAADGRSIEWITADVYLTTASIDDGCAQET